MGAEGLPPAQPVYMPMILDKDESCESGASLSTSQARAPADIPDLEHVLAAAVIKYGDLASQDLIDISAWLYGQLSEVHPVVEEHLGPHKEVTLHCLYWLLIAGILVAIFIAVGLIQALWRRLIWGSSYSEDETYKETATNLANSMRMLIDKQSREQYTMGVEKRRLEEHVNALQSELDRIVAAIENSNGEPGSLHAIAAAGNRVRLGSGNSDGGRHLGPAPSRGLRRNRDRAPGGERSGGPSRGSVAQPKSIASDSLTSAIAANAAMLSGREQSRSPPKGMRGLFQRLAGAIPETDEHPVVGFMPSPTPRGG